MELELADPADDPARPVALGGAMRLRPGPPPIAKRDRRSGGSPAKSRDRCGQFARDDDA